ncbi:MAG: amidohydrolase [Candidatus Bathyarchaeota archaeon]|uniref:amidohydrolase n=1 Tax=Candidatus Bathycorpusculum sp. TaxID=2994959 RepID=UPI00282CB7D8|nr:amidohydrolase [Candidatus Termiticorpusculum sp.]MCL2256599.1 amidohydrolase [Candidatus Termiticorpusculum sp.]MCL2293221.1 amidohydrolase [Candidatus Termiticorpusculum sp.]
MTPADLVLLDGNIITMNSKMPLAQAIAVRGNRLSCVGSNKEVKPHIGKKTHVIYLEGKTVLPGFIDTHAHVVDYAKMLTWLDLQKVFSIKDIQTLLSERVKHVSEDQWVLGRALNPEGLLEKQLPWRHDLDISAPNNPVVLYCQTGQVCVVNSKAIELANIHQQNNLGIERDPLGEPTGILRDSATNFVWNIIPEPTQQELYKTTKLALENFVHLGITSVHWIVLSEVELLIIQKLVETDSLPLRVYLIVPMNLLDLALQKLKPFENSFFKLGGCILFIDGYLADRTAALSEPYSDSSGNQRKLFFQQKEMITLANKIQNSGLQLVIHAVGDTAIQEAINITRHIDRNPAIPRPRIEQAAVLTPQLMHCIKELDLSVSVQPCVIASEFSVWAAEKRLGKKRVRWLFPIKEMLNYGILVSAGSDCPMEPLNPLFGVEAAVKRESVQKVSVFEALQMYTTSAAQTTFLDIVDKGSIEQGKLADFVVLSDNPESITDDKTNGIFVCFTVLNGVVYCSKK